MEKRKIRLEGLTQKGKNRIQEQGDEWEVLSERMRVGFSSQPGPWLLLQSVKSPDKIRWIHKDRDENFKVIQE